MRPMRLIGAAAALFVLALEPACPQGKALKIIVPYTAGSGPDIISRLMSEQISRANGPTVVVENRPGAGTVIGTEAAARAEPDGGTVLLVANSFVINAVSVAMQAPEVQPRLAQQGLFPAVSCGAPFNAFLRKTADDYERIINDAGIKAN